MKKIKNRICTVSIILFAFINQQYAQWQNTNFPDSIQVNIVALNDSLIFAGTKGEGVFVSRDNGMNWKQVNNGLQNKVINTILIDGNNMYVGNELGVSLSTNNGIDWNSLNNGLANLGVWSLAINKNTSGSTLFAGTWSGVYSSTNNGNNWKVTGLAETVVPVNSVIAMNNFVYATTIGDLFFQSSDNGNTWKDISWYSGNYVSSSFGGPDRLVEKLGVKPTYALTKINSNIVVSVGNAFICYKTPTATQFANQTNATIADNPITSFASQGNILYGATPYGEIIYSENNAVTWKKFSPDLRFSSLCSIAINNYYIFAGMAKGLKRLYFPSTTNNEISNSEIPASCQLYQNYPNPFNPTTSIQYQVSSDSDVLLKVYDVLGREVAALVDEYKPAGNYSVTFNVSYTSSSVSMPSGVYYYKLTAGNFSEVKKMLFVK